MLGWIERVVPQPPVPHLAEETPPAPVRDPEPAKVSGEPVWGVPCELGREMPSASVSSPCTATPGDAPQHPQEGWRPGGISPSELLGGSRKDGDSLGFAASLSDTFCLLP